MTKEEIFGKIRNFLLKNGAKEISVFGSYASGDYNNRSDIDLLVEFSERKSLLDMVIIENELSDLIGIKVDLLTKKAISPYLINNIMNSRTIIFQ